MIFEYFCATGAYETVQGLLDLFTMSLQHDDVRWEDVLLSVCEVPPDAILEGLYKSKFQNYVQLRTVLALYDQERQWDTELQEIKNCSDTSC